MVEEPCRKSTPYRLDPSNLPTGTRNISSKIEHKGRVGSGDQASI